ncbi:MAG TPA: class I SAM-dependent methyltransferase [Phototrophicaceae bacterium]|nr:class I SAM-dependent methyltransferase [Phototrophicaceae bacterium]
MSQQEQRPPICDYEGSNYRTEFWEGRGRGYEDRVERIALERLLPHGGRRMLEVGAGFGRLTSEYDAFGQVVLLDYSLSQLQYAQENLGRSARYVYVAADAYHLPFHPGVFDAATMVRVIHHMSNVEAALTQVRRVLVPSGVFILEHANKRNLKAIVRHALKQQSWSPYDLTPVEFIELNFDFHPEYIRRELIQAGFDIQERLPVSLFRMEQLKEAVPLDVLTRLDSLFQSSGLLYTPSIFVRSIAVGSSPNNLGRDMLFACPECGGELSRRGDTITCLNDGLRWAIRDGIYDFKAPLESEE